MFNNFFLKKSCHLRDNEEKYCRAGKATYDNMAHIPNATNKHTHTHTHTHTEYVILVAFPLQQWFLECTSMLR